MKSKFTLTIFLLLLVVCAKVAAQDAASVSQRANQQFVLFESERDKGGTPDAMYAYLLESYREYVKVLSAPNNQSYLNGAKNRLRNMYPSLLDAAVYYSGQQDPVKGLDFAAAYIELPKLKIFQDELLPRASNYAVVVYFAAQSAYNQQKYTQATDFFKEYLRIGDKTQEKDCYVYLNMIYMAQKNYVEQEKILEEAITKYPVSLDFLYNLVNVHIATNNMPKLLSAIDRILEIDPNNMQVLPIKARILLIQKKNEEALEIFKRLYALEPDNFEYMTGLARANFNVATEIANSGLKIANDTEYALIRQRASGYLLDAKDLFLKILEKDPTAKMYMQGLAGVYDFMQMKPEYEVLSQILEDGASFDTFPERLKTYMAEMQKPEAATQPEAAPVPVPLEPAMLVIRVDSFIDGNNNKVIDAGESFAIQFTIENRGKGDAYNLRLRFSEQQGYDEFFDGPRELDGGNILAGASKQYTFRYLVKKDMPTTLAKINIYAFEANGFDANPAELVVNTLEYAMPRLQVADYMFVANEGSTITRNNGGQLKLALQNLGAKTARNVKVNFKLPRNIFPTEQSEMILDSIAPGEVEVVDYGFLVNNRFDGDSVAVMVSVTEDTHSSNLNEAYKVKLDEYLASDGPITIDGDVERPTVAAKDFHFGFESELLRDVPVGAANPHRYALVIGNENYSLAGNNAEINVPYAANDAYVFGEYCKRTFGVPDKQIKVISNATAGIMHEMLGWLVSMASVDPEAELIFYYSGHGNNYEVTKEPYLLPVDISGKNIRLGISLANLYKQLATYPVKGAYVFLDACFSGASKSGKTPEGLKGVRVVPKMGLPQGHTLSFASSSGDQFSSVYHEKKQGYYTYFLIKAIQDAKGNLTLKQLFDQTTKNVKTATTQMGRPQDPQYMVAPMWTDWENVQLRTPLPEEAAGVQPAAGN